MNNKTFIQGLAKRTGTTQEETQKMVFSLIDAMNENFQEGKAVTFPNFGTFDVKKRMERIVVNPVTRQKMLVPPKLVLYFKPIAAIKKELKQGGQENE